jgi:tetratricopeptide (TPR) repeat protein
MGIIDEESGTMYYFNSEHPWSVLYRNNRANFIKQEFPNRKIGTTIGVDKLSIDTLKLEAGDVIICGSDGRDDLIIGKDEKTGKDIINNDMHAFLRFVENGKGDLEKIVENIKNYGKLMDDLSLLKITYKPNNEKKEEPKIPDEFAKCKEEGIKAYESNDCSNAIKHFRKAINIYNEEDVYCKLIHCCISMKNFQMAIAYSEKSIALFPTSLNLMYYTSVSYKKSKQYEKAIYYGRRLYIHRPNNINNLINLIDSYILIGDYNHATEYLKEAEKVEPDNKTIIKLKNILSQK